MFGVDSTELFIIAIAALVFIGPKDLPRVMMTVGRWVGRMRGHARHFTAGIENMMREAELEEMEKKWREENARILSLHPADGNYPDPAPVMTALPPEPIAGEIEHQPDLPLSAPAAPDDDPRPPSQRPLP
jgi:sec-independent protein translocase protein TatB